MANRRLQFLSCVNEYLETGAPTPTNYRYIAVGTPAEVATMIPDFYANHTECNLAGKVQGIGYGWQKYQVETSGKVLMTVRGAAGGMTCYSDMTIHPVTGKIVYKSNGNPAPNRGCRGGRGAKLQAEIKLAAGDILYILVGMRGWCNYNNVDYGAGGGGASVVLRVNPNGPYKFSPTGEKVDVLMVAGGGGGPYDSSYGEDPNRMGKDASFNDGLNTNGGTSANARGGAGLTGNGSSGSGGNIAYSLLSGNPSYTSSFGQVHQGGWGGGGGSYDGGGGGGGYSGGAARSNSYGGEGGTSYMNPLYCTEVFRGYATVELDSERNMSNPWIAYGQVEIEVLRSKDKLILVKDNGVYKWFNGREFIDDTPDKPSAPNQWEAVPTADLADIFSDYPSEATFKKYGNTVITNTSGLTKGNVRFLIKSITPDDIASRQESLSISGNVNGAIIKMNKDAKLSDVSEFLSAGTVSNLTDTVVRFAVSKDHGNSWLTYKDGMWKTIDITSKQTFQDDGCSLSLINTIPVTDWTNLKTKELRFAFCITQIGSSANQFKLEEVYFMINQTGSWKGAKESDFDYEYISSDQLKVTFKVAGSYKVNYLDKVSE